MREELQRTYHESAQKFINEEVERQRQQLMSEYQQRWQEEAQRLQAAA